MFEQLTDLVKQFSGDAVVNNPAVPKTSIMMLL